MLNLSQTVKQGMLKITTKEREGSITLTLEGRLCGAWANEAEQAWSQVLAGGRDRDILLDLAGVPSLTVLARRF